MLIVISGTPGTGKTDVAKLLGKKLRARLLTTNYLVKKYKIKTHPDKKRKTKIIDTKKLAAAAKKEANRALAIFEGHLAHFTPADLTIILRTNPKELEERLKKKKWIKKKIKENVEAEAIGVISNETGKKKNVIEIDTTGKTPQNTATLILKLLNKYQLQKRYLRKIDWTKEYMKYLNKKIATGSS